MCSACSSGRDFSGSRLGHNPLHAAFLSTGLDSRFIVSLFFMRNTLA
jgi:hypothetical protein